MMILRSVGVLSCGKVLGCLYALLGFLIGGVIVSGLYNLIAGLVGGIELELAPTQLEQYSHDL